MDSYFSSEELKGIGFKKMRSNIRISRNVKIYNDESIEYLGMDNLDLLINENPNPPAMLGRME